MSNNRLCKVLGIEKPIIQGPMAWISTAPLVAAVSENGGLGVLGVGFASLEFIEQQIKATKSMTSKPFGINVVMMSEMLDQVSAIVLKEKVPVVTAVSLKDFDLEMCNKYFSLWHDAGMKVVAKTRMIREALTAEKAGADVIIVKGWEGGGHVTPEATLCLVPQAADCISVPLVASGGIADGRGMAAAIALGADGIEMGTVFMCAKETDIHPNVKEVMIGAGDMETVITGSATDAPCRQLKNKLSDDILEIEANNIKKVAAEKLLEIAASSLKKAMMEGDVYEKGAVMAGQIVPLITEIKSAEEIMDDVLRVYHETVTRMVKFEV
jgi:enoyl-[acyl-carrier protein] reductase II